MHDVPAWQQRFISWVNPFLEALDSKGREEMAKLYLVGLMGPGDRKSLEPITNRFAPGQHQRLHHFISASMWNTDPLDAILMKKINDLVGGPESHLIIDDTALVKQGKHSVGVAHQYCGQLGKNANCQCLVTLTLARDEIPVPAAMQLYLPESWCTDTERRAKTKVPEDRVFQEKWRIALDEIDRLIAWGVQFSDVLTDAGYGAAAEFRHALTERRLIWAVGITHQQHVYPLSVQLECANASDLAGRTRKHPKPDQPSLSAKR